MTVTQRGPAYAPFVILRAACGPKNLAVVFAVS
jgi:hypothetical protein